MSGLREALVITRGRLDRDSTHELCGNTRQGGLGASLLSQVPLPLTPCTGNMLCGVRTDFDGALTEGGRGRYHPSETLRLCHGFLVPFSGEKRPAPHLTLPRGWVHGE